MPPVRGILTWVIRHPKNVKSPWAFSRRKSLNFPWGSKASASLRARIWSRSPSTGKSISAPVWTRRTMRTTCFRSGRKPASLHRAAASKNMRVRIARFRPSSRRLISSSRRSSPASFYWSSLATCRATIECLIRRANWWRWCTLPSPRKSLDFGVVCTQNPPVCL